MAQIVDVVNAKITQAGKLIMPKEGVSFDRFVELLNAELHRRESYQEGMRFINVGTGYDFEAPMLTIIENRALDKLIFDAVSANYTITRS